MKPLTTKTYDTLTDVHPVTVAPLVCIDLFCGCIGNYISDIIYNLFILKQYSLTRCDTYNMWVVYAYMKFQRYKLSITYRKLLIF